MDARCQCGQLCATVADLARPITMLCHCADCQRRTGSPFGVIAYFDRSAVTVAGEAHEYSRTNHIGNTVTNGFCPACGSTIYVRLSKNEALLGVPVGAFADPAFPAPAWSVWEQRKHHWVELAQTIAGFEKGTDGK